MGPLDDGQRIVGVGDGYDVQQTRTGKRKKFRAFRLGISGGGGYTKQGTKKPQKLEMLGTRRDKGKKNDICTPAIPQQ